MDATGGNFIKRVQLVSERKNLMLFLSFAFLDFMWRDEIVNTKNNLPPEINGVGGVRRVGRAA